MVDRRGITQAGKGRAMEPAIKASDVRKRILEQIDEMPAGSIFDDFIEREIMKGRFDLGENGSLLYTSFSGQALTVLDKVNNQEYGAEIVMHPDGYTRVTFRVRPWSDSVFTYNVIGKAETFALAICRACAKKAIMEKWDRERGERWTKMNR